MGYAELIQQRLQTLPVDKQAEVYDFVEFIAMRSQSAPVLDDDQRRQNVMAVLASARNAWAKMSDDNINQLASSMRTEWDGRGWEGAR